MKTLIIKAGELVCPNCETRHPLMSGAGQPKAGDYCICITCLYVAVLDENRSGFYKRAPRTSLEKSEAADALANLMQQAHDA